MHGEKVRVKKVAVDGLVVSVVVDEAREAASASGDVNGLEEVGEHFAKMLDIIVGWFANDGGKGGGQLMVEVLHAFMSSSVDMMRKGRG